MHNDPEIEFLAPMGSQLSDAAQARPLIPFSPQVLAFLGELSQALREDQRARTLPDVYAFAFWCRPASLQAMQRDRPLAEPRLGRGLVFHIAPGNVPVNFAYSLCAGLLAGNSNIVRAPSENFAQVRLIAEWVDHLLKQERHSELRHHVRLVRYPRDAQNITAQLSSLCDVRVIWGGDATIEAIRRAPLAARAFDLTFADRYSLCVIGARAYLDQVDRKALAQGFYNDTYLFDQNACTAPHLVLWLGEAPEVEQARTAFWEALEHLVEVRYELQPRAAIDKWSHALHYAAKHPGARILQGKDNRLTRVEIPALTAGIENWHANSGLFFEYRIRSLGEIAPIVNRRFQTLSHAGIDEPDLHEMVFAGRLTGIDRIVPIGRTLEFSLHWDGHHLPSALSRVIDNGIGQLKPVKD